MESAFLDSLAFTLVAAIPVWALVFVGILKFHNPKSMRHAEMRKRLERLR